MMKKLTKLTKTLLVAAGLLVGGNAWAGDVTTLYERGNGTAWSDADLTDWVASGVTPTIDGGLKIATYNAGWTITKTIAPTSNAIVTLNASITGAKASGNNGSYDYIQIGGVALRLYGQAQTAKIYVDGTETQLASSITRGGTYTIKIVINTATNAVTYAYNGGDDVVTASTTAISNIIVGHKRAGSEATGWGTFDVKLNSITVTNEAQDVSTADYTVKWVDNSDNVLKSEVRNGTVGAAAVLTASDKANFYTRDGEDNITGKYIYQSDDASTSSIASDGSTVVKITFKAAGTFSYTVKSSLGGTIASGSNYESENISYYFPHYLLSGTNLYKKDKNGSNPWYGNTFTLTSNNQIETVTYTDAEVANVVYLKEAEEIMTATGKAGANVHIRCSGGMGGYSDSNVEVTTLAPGKYKITGAVWGNGKETLKVVDASDNIYWSLDTNGNWTETTGAEFTLYTSTTLYVTGGNDSKCLDYLYIQRTGDLTEHTLTLPSSGYASLASAYGLNFAGISGLTAFVVTGITKDAVTLTSVDELPASQGVILKGTGGETYSIPVKADAAAYTGTNKLQAAVEATNIEANKAYILQGGKFHLVNAASTVPAGKAYLLASDVPSQARALSFMFGDEASGISDVVREMQSGEFYNLSGQRVAAPKSGLYIVNGKKVIIK